MPETGIPTEVELAFELMPCQAERVAQEPVAVPHPCAYFRRWGTYHSFDYGEPGPPKASTVVRSQYVGRAPLVPEMLSGCRKAPIMAVGINPNLPGWWSDQQGSLNPLFDDYRQYAHYFRYRKMAKPELSGHDYLAYGGGPADTPPGSTLTLTVPPDPEGRATIALEWRDQKMYLAYQSLLDDLAAAMNWPAGRLAVGEDLSYGNMVACPSAKWTTNADPHDPRLPPMSVTEQGGIVHACFRERQYFLRQLFQSLPAVLLVFSQSTARAFIGEVGGRLHSTPQTTGADAVASLMHRRVLLHYGDLPDGTSLDARVIFAPHPTGDPTAWAPAKPLVVAQLVECVSESRLAFNTHTARLTRTRGSCVFCTLLDIGPCDYHAEIAPLEVVPALTATSIPGLATDKPTQQRMLSAFVAAQAPDLAAWSGEADAGS